ncbi:protein-tyrosine phosphatase-like protein, partial [Trichophaea hybrida]
DWKYEYRREAQQLLPHLFLGPLSSTKNTSFLQQNNITLLLAVRSSMTARARLLGGGGGSGGGGGGSNNKNNIPSRGIDVANNSELISQFQRAQEIIDSHYLRVFQETWMTARGNRNVVPGGKTLLFCESGNERSAVVAAAYIMQHLGGSTVQAIQMVQGRRFCVCFDDAMKWMLTSYEPIWKA